VLAVADTHEEKDRFASMRRKGDERKTKNYREKTRDVAQDEITTGHKGKKSDVKFRTGDARGEKKRETGK